MTAIDVVVVAGGAPTPAEREAILAAGRALLLLADEPGGARAGARPDPYASAWRRAGLAESLAPPLPADEAPG